MAVRLLQVINQPCVNRLSLIQSYNAVVNGLFPHTLTWTLNHIGTHGSAQAVTQRQLSGIQGYIQAIYDPLFV